MKKFNLLDWVAIVLVIIGGLNWGLVGVFQLDLISSIFGDMTMLSRTIYGLVGLSALYMVWLVMAMQSEK